MLNYSVTPNNKEKKVRYGFDDEETNKDPDSSSDKKE